MMPIDALRIYCADIGSISKGRFGWAFTSHPSAPVHEEYGGREIIELADRVATDLTNGMHVSLGFECPEWIPISDDPLGLTSQRDGERGRPWSAGAGSGALATGLSETVWILRRVRSLVDPSIAAFLNWPAFVAASSGLYLWEAFVTGSAKGDSHHGDAAIAVATFSESLPAPETSNAVISHGDVQSLIGAAMIRTGWSSDIGLLSTPCLVLRS